MSGPVDVWFGAGDQLTRIVGGSKTFILLFQEDGGHRIARHEEMGKEDALSLLRAAIASLESNKAPISVQNFLGAPAAPKPTPVPPPSQKPPVVRLMSAPLHVQPAPPPVCLPAQETAKTLRMPPSPGGVPE